MVRDDHGRFLRGGGGGPGRPKKSIEEQYAECIKRALSAKDVIDVFHRMLAAAKKGDVSAGKLVLSYTLGLPADSVVEARLAMLERGEPQRMQIDVVYEDGLKALKDDETAKG